MFILASYRDFAVQSGTYCHKDSLFKDKVKPMRLFTVVSSLLHFNRAAVSVNHFVRMYFCRSSWLCVRHHYIRLNWGRIYMKSKKNYGIVWIPSIHKDIWNKNGPWFEPDYYDYKSSIRIQISRRQLHWWWRKAMFCNTIYSAVRKGVIGCH